MRKSFPHYTQLDSMDCGPTCLRMIAKHYGRSYTLQNLRERSFITQAVVDQGIGANNLGFITLMLIAQLVLSITQMGMGFIQSWITLHTNTRISISLISDFLTKLMKLPIRFFDAKNIGDILQRIGDHSRIQSFLSGTTLTTLFSFANFFVFSFILAYYNLEIVTVFLTGNILYLAWIISFIRYRRKLDYKRFVQASANQSSMVQLINLPNMQGQADIITEDLSLLERLVLPIKKVLKESV